MDRSVGYICLCMQAKEIQVQWRPRHGDFFLGENHRIECWVDSVHAGRQIHKGFGITRKESKVISLTPYVWLPRLDQVMELAQVPGRRFESVSQEFYTWTKTPYDADFSLPSQLFATLEQSWLAFVMRSRHGKIWNGADWIVVAVS